MSATYKIHPGIGIARVGNSPDQFCISPEEPAALPIECDAQGNPKLSADGKSVVRVSKFKDAEGRIKRCAARFQIYVYDDGCPEGRPLQIGDQIDGGGNRGVLVDIQWRAYLANKKAAWYEFSQLDGEHGYAAKHPWRNADITDPDARQKLIIDPGPQVVDTKNRRSAKFDRNNSLYAPTFPPKLKPYSIDTLGELKVDDGGRLLVLGGHGHAGSFKFDEFGQPRITAYANNDGWFDDVSDGPVMARLVMFEERVNQVRFIDVEYPAWVVVGYPAYVPEILDMVTMEDVITDMAIRQFAIRTDLYGKPGTYDKPQQVDVNDTDALIHWRSGLLAWNPDYKPWFYRDIWPILFRPDEFTYLTNVLAQSNFPHNQTERGTFNVERLSLPPVVNERALRECETDCIKKNHSGQLFVESLMPAVTSVDSLGNATLGQAVSDFDRAVTAQVKGLESQGQEFPAEEQQKHADEIDVLREMYPRLLGDLLFGNFLDSVKEAAGLYAQEVYGKTPGPQLAAYSFAWVRGVKSEDAAYENLRRLLDEGIDTLIKELGDQAIVRWNEQLDHIGNVFAKWGSPFGDLLTQLRQEVSKVVRIFIFERLGDATKRKVTEFRNGKPLATCKAECLARCTYDPFARVRRYLFRLLRMPGEENDFKLAGQPNDRTNNLPLMPLLCGDNPISNTLASKFLRLTDYQLYILRQWADGKFYNEELEGWAKPDPYLPYQGWENKTGNDLDRGVMTNLLGGAFCPGGEVTWIIRNPAIYKEPFRIKADEDFYSFRQTAAQANANRGAIPNQDYVSYVKSSLSQQSDFEKGLQPGDLTKYMALPWQADFNECSTQQINVTYEQFNKVYADSESNTLLKKEEQVWETLWWPAHRPLETPEVVGFSNAQPTIRMLDWTRGIPGTNAGDEKMVEAWSLLGFVVRNPYLSDDDLNQPSPQNKYISIERNHEEGI